MDFNADFLSIRSLLVDKQLRVLHYNAEGGAKKISSKSLAQAANRAGQSKLTSMFITNPANADVSSESTEDNATTVHMSEEEAKTPEHNIY